MASPFARRRRLPGPKRSARGLVAILEQGEHEERIEGSHPLVAAGRRPNIQELDLDWADIEHDPKGIKVDARLRTTNPRIYAVGDVAGAPQFTHIAHCHTGIVLRNALFRLRARAAYRALPWVSYTDPELAQVGLTENDARRVHGDNVQALRWPFDEVDRAQTAREARGMIKALTR